MKWEQRHCDVIVIGAGPAGLSAARKLASVGRRVAVVADGGTRRVTRLESIRGLEVLEHAFPGLQWSGSDPGLHRSRSGENWWSGSLDPTPEILVVERGVFDRALEAEVSAMGVEWIRSSGRGTTSVQRTSDGWLVREGGKSWSCKLVLDAGGRHSRLRRKKKLVDWKQCAVAREWQCPDDVPAIWTESLPNAWMFGIRGACGRMAFSVFADAEDFRGGSQMAWERHFATSRLAARASHWQSLSPPVVCEATPVCADPPTLDVPLPIGDAALARDPLASQGLTAGIADGMLGAIFAHTCLTDSSRERLALDFISGERQRAVARHLRSLAVAYRAAPYESKFWAARQGMASDLSQDFGKVVLSMDDAVALSPSWGLKRGAALTQDLITEEEVLCSNKSEDPESIAWLEGRPIGKFLPPDEKPRSIRSLLLHWIRQGVATESMALNVLRWLVGRGIFIRIRGSIPISP